MLFSIHVGQVFEIKDVVFTDLFVQEVLLRPLLLRDAHSRLPASPLGDIGAVIFVNLIGFADSGEES